MKKNIRKYITEESIIAGDGQKKVKIPIKGLELPEFRFGKQSEGLGSGRGSLGEGDSIGSARGRGQKGGQGTAEHIYEEEVTIDELVEIAFEELGLPNLEEKSNRKISVKADVFEDIRKSGPISRVDAKRTIKMNMKRNAFGGKAEIKNISREDLRFKSFTEKFENESNALIIAMMDVSGSMTEHKKYLVRMTLWWIKKYLEREYDGLEFLFIIHDTRAQLVDEKLFFATTTGGGTEISSAFALALKTIERNYVVSEWNIYPFYFSDGENFDYDNAKAVELANKLISYSKMFYYGQVDSGGFDTFDEI
ncbi:MAG: DUF444 family protein, partial [Thermoplasmata archaeon]